MHDFAYIAVDANLNFIKKHLAEEHEVIKQRQSQDYLDKLLHLKDEFI